MDWFGRLIEQYGLKTAILVYLGKTLFDIFRGQTIRYIRAVEANTLAIEKLRKDLRVAFHNIKQLREKNEMGELSIPEVDQ